MSKTMKLQPNLMIRVGHKLQDYWFPTPSLYDIMRRVLRDAFMYISGAWRTAWRQMYTEGNAKLRTTVSRYGDEWQTLLPGCREEPAFMKSLPSVSSLAMSPHPHAHTESLQEQHQGNSLCQTRSPAPTNEQCKWMTMEFWMAPFAFCKCCLPPF